MNTYTATVLVIGIIFVTGAIAGLTVPYYDYKLQSYKIKYTEPQINLSCPEPQVFYEVPVTKTKYIAVVEFKNGSTVNADGYIVGTDYIVVPVKDKPLNEILGDFNHELLHLMQKRDCEHFFGEEVCDDEN